MHDTQSTGSSPRRIRLNNVVAALQGLYGAGRMSRADLARKLGLNRSSSGQIVAELTQGGLVREVDVAAAPAGVAAGSRTRLAGRPGILLELVPDAACFVGIEIGVEHISAVVIDLCGRTAVTRKEAFDAPSAPVEAAVARGVALAFGAMGSAMTGRCRGVGVSAPMHIRPDGTVSLAPLIGWRDVELVGIVAAHLPKAMPILIENDANAFAIGDGYRHGEAGVTLYLDMETGIGGGILIDGKLFRGGHGLAGEIGHTLVPGSGGLSLERLIGREAVVAKYRLAAQAAGADLADLIRAVGDREPAAVSVAEDWARHLAHALVQACRLIDPGRIVLGGSVAALYPLVAARVAAHMGSGQTLAFPVPRIVVDASAEFGSAFGAACLMHQRFLSLKNETLIGDDALAAAEVTGAARG
ncbi:MAG: ROK family protein [Paracoccaceae bacterium]